MYREARICFTGRVQIDGETFEGEMDLPVELEHGWVGMHLGGDRAPRRVSLPADRVAWILWREPEKYGPTVSRGGI
ncbi:hypothetical protein SAMN05414137_11169 [Streptacidiphilus jiangxiensis]|uniref:Uncharacterized protein n=1 Tax=Streptacidiphilus jiangxiensis TaxID=235985 RepID=A0A1H7RZS2_STRJI|nr:hypothetical protein SAMN05414137_11169 [Streptacidiphilus jiangxiensis]